MTTKIIFKNTFYQLVSKFFTSGVSFIATIIIARHFGVLGYGDFAKITSFVAIFYLIADFGLNAIFLREDEKKIHFKDLFYFRIALALILIFLANVISFFLPFNKQLNLGFSENVRLGIFIFSFSILSQAMITTGNAIFQKKMRYDFSALSIITGSMTGFILTITFVLLDFPLHYILFAFMAGGFISGLFSIFFTKEKIFFNLDYAFIKKLVKESLPLGLMLIFNLIYFRIDILLLSFLKPTIDVGVYGFSYKFFDFLIALPIFLSNALYPSLLTHKKNYRSFFSITKKYFFVLLVSSLLLVFVFWFLAELIPLVKGDFSLSILPFRLLLLSLPFFFTTSILQWALIAQKEQKFLMYIYLISAVFNVLLNLIFIPSASYIASAIITGVSEIVVFTILALKMILIQKKYAK